MFFLKRAKKTPSQELLLPGIFIDYEFQQFQIFVPTLHGTQANPFCGGPGRRTAKGLWCPRSARTPEAFGPLLLNFDFLI